MELESAILELLSRLEFVSLPGLGSFVKKYESASLSADSKVFNPPREFFIFDTTRAFNDESIENYICETAGIDRKQASILVEQFVKKTKAALAQGDEVLFAGVGTLKQNAVGGIELLLMDDSMCQTFGFSPIDVSIKLTDKKVDPAEPEKKEELKPMASPAVAQKLAIPDKSKKGVFAIVVVGIAALASVFVFIPEVRFWEESSSRSVPVAQVGNLPNEVAGDSVVTCDSAVNVISTESTDTLVKPSIEPAVDKRTALYYQEPKGAEGGKTFYIIAGSYSLEGNAQKMVQELSEKGYKPLIIQNNNMYRVAIYKFSNRDRALRELERLKTKKISDKVWLLTL